MENFWSGFKKTAAGKPGATMKDYFMSIGALGKKPPLRQSVSKVVKPPSQLATDLAKKLQGQYGSRKYIDM